MTEESLIAFLNMQYAFISNPIKKLQLLSFMNEIYEQQAEKELEERTQYTIVEYAEKQIKKKKHSIFQKCWFQTCLQLFQELENDIKKTY